MIAGTSQPGQVTGQPGQVSLDRTVRTGNLDRTARIGPLLLIILCTQNILKNKK
jgi:hypothetical protein